MDNFNIINNFWNNYEFEINKYYKNKALIYNFSKEIKLINEYNVIKNKISEFINLSFTEIIIDIKDEYLNYHGRHFYENIKKWYSINNEFVISEKLIFDVFSFIINSKKNFENKIILFKLLKKFIIQKNKLLLEYMLSYAIQFNYIKIVGALFYEIDSNDFVLFDKINNFIDLKNIQPDKLIKFLKPKYTLDYYQEIL